VTRGGAPCIPYAAFRVEVEAVAAFSPSPPVVRPERRPRAQRSRCARTEPSVRRFRHQRWLRASSDARV